jgi:glyoxylase-like metal-dependent hydrolase (beta-lactamase superfamily II)
MLDWMNDGGVEKDLKLAGLLVTHGHWDHILDAAAIQEKYKVSVFVHADSAPLLENPAIQASFNPFELRACKPDRVLRQETTLQLSKFEMKLLLCPGHCPGSLCFHFVEEKKVFGGDVLFAGGVGRWDLPGGSQPQLLDAIAQNILVLPDETRVYPGHGPFTTVGKERRTNPFLSDLR